MGVVQKIGNALIQICVGIAQGARPVIAYNYAAGDRKRTKSLAIGALSIMAVFTVTGVIIVELIPGVLVHLFLPSGKAVEVAQGYLRIWILCIIGIGMIEVFNSIFQALNLVNIAMANTLINKGLLLTPVLLILIRFIGINGVVISQPITENLTAIVLAIIYSVVVRKKVS